MNLATCYAEATEYNLATLSELCMLKSSSQARIKRQTSICHKMLQVCQEYLPEIDWGSGWSPRASQVHKLLQAASESNLEQALEEWERRRYGSCPGGSYWRSLKPGIGCTVKITSI